MMHGTLGAVGGGLEVDPLILGAAALLAVGAVVGGLANRLRTPGLLLFLGVGMLVGDDVLGWVRFSDTQLAQSAAVVALVLILFEGGLATSWSGVRRVLLPSAVLATAGTFLTAVIVALAAWRVLDIEPPTAFMLGAVVASTDAAAVFSLLRAVRLPERVTRMLEAESGLNDPLAVLLTVGAIQYWQHKPPMTELALFGVRQVVGGVIVGVVVGAVGAAVLNRFTAGSAALYPVLALACGGLAYGIAAEAEASGFLAVYLAGVIIGNLVDRPLRTIRVVHEGLAAAAQIGLFLLLGLLVFPSRIDEIAIRALIIAAVLVFVARPVAVALSLVWFRMTGREVAFVAWSGLRGAVPIVLATLPLTEGYPDGQLIFDIVFFVVLGSVALQGTTLGWVASKLRLTSDPGANAAAVEFIPTDTPGAAVAEIRLGPDATVCGASLRESPLPDGARVAIIVREGETIVPTGDTRLDIDDLLIVAIPPQIRSATAALNAWARNPTP